MFRPAFFSASAWLLVLYLSSGNLWAQSIHFDCAAIATAKTIDFVGGQKIVDIVLPISVSLPEDNASITEVQSKVAWSRYGYPVVDFEPKTSMQSQFDGPIEVEKNHQTSFKVGAKVSTNYLDFVAPVIDGAWKTENSEKRRFREIPDAQRLTSSGTVNRGTGVLFRFFHRGPQR